MYSLTLAPAGTEHRRIPARSGPRPVRALSGIQLAGFCGVAVLVIVTSGIPVPRPVVLTLGLISMGVVVLAWLELGRHTDRISVRRLYWFAASWCLPLLVARPLFSGDVCSYLAQGLIADKGFDPYLVGPAAALGADSPVTEQVSHYWRNTPAPYGPAFVALSRAIAHLAEERLPTTVLLHRFVELAAVVLIAWALPRLAGRVGAQPTTALWLGLLNPLVLWHVVAGVHSDGLMLGLMLAGMEIALGGLSRAGAAGTARIGAGVVVLTIAANIKIVAFAAVCFLGAELLRRWGGTVGRGIVVVLSLLAGCVAVSIAISAGTGLGLGWIGAMSASGQVHSWLAPTNQLGFLVGGLGAPAGTDLTPAAITLTTRLGAAIGAAIAVRLWWTTFRGRLHPLRGLGLVFAAMLVVGPVVQPWYLLWAVLPLAAIARPGRACWVLAALSAVFAVLLPPTGGSVSMLIQGYLVAAVMLGGALLLWRAHRPHPAVSAARTAHRSSSTPRGSGRRRRVRRAVVLAPPSGITASGGNGSGDIVAVLGRIAGLPGDAVGAAVTGFGRGSSRPATASALSSRRDGVTAPSPRATLRTTPAGVPSHVHPPRFGSRPKSKRRLGSQLD